MGHSAHAHYSAYGLRIASEIELRELPPAIDPDLQPPDVVIRRGPVGHDFAPVDEGGHAFAALEDVWLYHFNSAGSFRVSNGNEIVFESLHDASEDVVRLSLMGPVLVLALLQRNQFVLHASAVTVGGAAVAFCGGHGFGKSTTAAFFYAAGYPVLGDDVTALRREGEKFVALPSFPQFKLWPNSLEALGEDQAALPRVHPEFDKRAFSVDTGFESEPRPLARIYTLAVGPTIEIEPVAASEALELVLMNWFGSRYGPDLLHAVGTATHFKRCAEVVRAVPVHRLLRPKVDLKDPGFARDLVDAVALDAESFAD